RTVRVSPDGQGARRPVSRELGGADGRRGDGGGWPAGGGGGDGGDGASRAGFGVGTAWGWGCGPPVRRAPVLRRPAGPRLAARRSCRAQSRSRLGRTSNTA